MGIALDQERTTGTPVVKRRAIGERMLACIVKYEQRDMLKLDPDTNERKPVPKANGKNKQELVVHLLYIAGDMPAGIGEHEGVPEAGDQVRLIFKGGGFGQWIDAGNEFANKHKRSKEVGDMIGLTTDEAKLYTHEGNEVGTLTTPEEVGEFFASPKSRSQTIGFRGQLFLRPPKDEEMAWIAKAEAAYHALERQGIQLDEPADRTEAIASSPTGVPAADDGDPF